MTKIAHATKNEIGTVTGGMLGDQTGMEVVIQDFFQYDWTLVFRPINKTTADKMAAYAEIIARNDYIGYGQGSDRYTMYIAARNNGYNFGAITTPCATDCSQLMATLCIACGMSVSPYMYTGNEEGCLDQTGQFEKLPYERFMDLKRGDILLTTKKGHTAIVVEGSFPSHIPLWVGEAYGMDFIPVYVEPNEGYDRAEWPTLAAGNLFDVCDETVNWYYIRIAGAYFGWIQKPYVLRKTPKTTGHVTSAVNVRTNPGTEFPIIGVAEEDSIVTICDVKKASNNRDWYYIQFADRWGFASSKYIEV